MKSKLLIILFSMALISSSYSSKKTALDSDGSANFRQSPVDENGMMIVAKLKVKADKVKAFTEAAKEIIEKSNNGSDGYYNCALIKEYDLNKLPSKDKFLKDLKEDEE